MNRQAPVTRWITLGLLALVTLSFASTAFAGHAGGSRRYKGVHGAFPAQRVVIHQRSSNAGPVLAGLIGGFILGSALASDVHPVVVHPHHSYRRPVVVYRYYDPYGDNWYDSLDDCDVRHQRVRVIQVIDIRSGRHVRTLRYHGDGWQRVSGDYDARDLDRIDARYDGHDDEGFGD